MNEQHSVCAEDKNHLLGNANTLLVMKKQSPGGADKNHSFGYDEYIIGNARSEPQRGGM